MGINGKLNSLQVDRIWSIVSYDYLKIQLESILQIRELSLSFTTTVKDEWTCSKAKLSRDRPHEFKVTQESLFWEGIFRE
jgi:hypothetical protein